MPRVELDAHFDNERPEWTKRKHQLLERIIVPSAEKLKKFGCLALIDGYAGPNEYGREVLGSTVIMAKSAARLRNKGFPVKVFACEEDPDRYEKLCRNLQAEIDSGLLIAYPKRHADVVHEIQKQIVRWPAVVFLDPHGPTDLQLKADLLPWLDRPLTDVLGVFMANAAARIVGEALSTGSSRAAAELILGARWQDGNSEEAACRVFLDAIGRKRFAGLYRLRKQDVKRGAYAIFGVSENVHAFQLLSDAVAKDWGALREYDFKKGAPRLLTFDDVHGPDEELGAFKELVELVRPILTTDRKLRGAALARALFSSGRGIEQAFGKYKDADFTAAAKACLKETPDG